MHRMLQALDVTEAELASVADVSSTDGAGGQAVTSLAPGARPTT